MYDRWGNRGLLTGSCNPGGTAAPLVTAETAGAVEAIFANNTLRMSNVDGGGNVQAVLGKTLTYDGDGRRVRRECAAARDGKRVGVASVSEFWH